MSPTGPEKRLRAPIRWNDLDALGHVNQTVYHALLEEIRYELFGALMQPGSRLSFVLANINLDFRHEVRREDEYVDVVGRIERVGGRSATAGHEILLPDGTVAAAGTSTVVAFDLDTRRSRELDAAEREALGMALPSL